MNAIQARYLGRRTKRIEDPDLLVGKGKYIDDIKIPGMMHAYFVRSEYAHARICSVDTSLAKKLPGVEAIYTLSDLMQVLRFERLPLAFPPGKLSKIAMPKILASDEVLYVGEPIVLIIASDRYIAEDAAELVVVDYEELTAVVDPRKGLKSESCLASSRTKSNTFISMMVGFGDCDEEFGRADNILSEEFYQHRGVPNPIEPRGLVATVNPGKESLSIWASSQLTHELRNTICEMLNFLPENVRVTACDIGGGFGCKFMVYSEEIAVSAAAILCDNPIKWIEDRREHFLSSIQERDQFWNVDVAFGSDGKLAAIRGRMVHDQGAYAPHSVTVPYNSASSVLGPYILPAYSLDLVVIRTNKPPVIPVRGAGYPQGTFIIERLLDKIADHLNLSRLAVRAKNLIPKEKFPFKTGLKNRAGKPVIYDSGDYIKCQNDAVERADIPDFKKRQTTARSEGRYLGIGFAHGVKCTGRGPFESATVRISSSGKVSIFTGAISIGQSTKTTLAQICAETLGVDIAQVNVVCGDTSLVQYGLGAFGSRQAMLAGSAVREASLIVKNKACMVAREMFENDLSWKFSNSTKELFLQKGYVNVRDRPDLVISLGAIASALRGSAGYVFPKDVEVGLEATHNFRADDMAYANTFHICEVEVDTESGIVKIDRYIALQDSGFIINPMTSEGQIHGGIVHGIGNALYEKMIYDGNGQPLTTNFADYLLPAATETPQIEVLFNESLSPLNPLGMKGVGEVSIVPVTSAIVSAIEDALKPIGIKINEVPISPVRLVELIMEKEKLAQLV